MTCRDCAKYYVVAALTSGHSYMELFPKVEIVIKEASPSEVEDLIQEGGVTFDAVFAKKVNAEFYVKMVKQGTHYSAGQQ